MTKQTKRQQLRKQKKSRKSRKVRTVNSKKIPNVYIQNFGSTKTLISNKNKHHEQELKWMGDYDGSEAKLQLDVINNDNDNENRKVYNFKLNNDQLSQLLGMNPVNRPIDERIRMDFLNDGNPNMDVNPNINKIFIGAPNEMSITPEDLPIFLNKNDNPVMFSQPGLQQQPGLQKQPGLQQPKVRQLRSRRRGDRR
jgi:hypothetical protein